ncbi:MAG TPA: hypothetical protein VN867_13095 [Candidatus Binataceae bacterium]|nr:hypothetical protein [Candidatus Binataceae bacterium]
MMRIKLKRSIARYAAIMGLITGSSLMGANIARATLTTLSYPSGYSVNYFNNPGVNGQDEIYIQNETDNGNSIPGTTYCAMLYAFYPDQEMIGCCGVAITPNQTWTNSIGQLMIHIDLAGPLPTNGTIKVVATNNTNPLCDPTGDTASVSPAPHALQSWITHTITLSSPPATFMTEVPFAQTGEPFDDLFDLEFQCQTVTGGNSFITCPGSL